MQNKIIHADIFEVKVTEKTNWLFIKLENNQNIVGWGEATLQGKSKEIRLIKDKLFELILNKQYSDPFFFKFKLPFNNIVEASISSSIMQCLWDIQGKIENKTISSLFGKKNDLIQTYANFNRSTYDRSLNGIKLRASEVLKDEYNFVKFAPFDEVDPSMETAEILDRMQFGLKRIDIIRNVLGPKVNIMIDCHWRFNYLSSIELIKECENFNLYWLECPIIENLENINDIKKIREKANNKGIKLAGLEKKILKEGYTDFLKAGSYDVMMPDIKYAGGPDELIEIEKIFNLYKVEFSPHNPSGPIAHGHTLHICSTINQSPLMETQYKETPLFDLLLNKPNPKINYGLSEVPNNENGLGISINETNLKTVCNYFL